MTQWTASPFFDTRDLVQSGQIPLRWSDWMYRAPSSIPEDVAVARKVEGMMLGLAIGDALGNVTESINPAARSSRYGWIQGYLPNRHAGGKRIGLPSDDTQLAFRTVQYLIEEDRPCLDPERLGYRLAHGHIFGIGQATQEWLARFSPRSTWYASGSRSAGNGALMRIAPVLIPHLSAPTSTLWDHTLVAAHLTHADELSNVSCLAFVDALWRAISSRGSVPRGWWLEHWLEACDSLGTGVRYQARNDHPRNFDGTISELLREHVRPALERALPVDVAGDIWHSGAYLLETIPTVIYILERFGNEPREAILQAVNLTRDSDTIAAIVGAAVGALHGIDALPAAWITGLSGRTSEDDDNRVFDLLKRSGAKFDYGSTTTVLARAAEYREPASAGLSAPEIPDDLPSGELWAKVTGFLQQNWAVVQPRSSGDGVRIWFVGDDLAIFDFIDYETLGAARHALHRNAFERFDAEAHSWLDSPLPQALGTEQTRRLRWKARCIYSSGQYWLDASPR